MTSLLNKVIVSVQQSCAAFYRYITANDTGATGSHQAGFYIPKCAATLLFDTLGVKGENKSRFVKIKWQDSFDTESRFIYYGKGTRNEYRITQFGRNFPFFTDDNIGGLLVIAKLSNDEYCGYVLQNDSDIDGFLSYFNLSPESNNRLIRKESFYSPDSELNRLFQLFISKYSDFPETKLMAEGARSCYNAAYKIQESHLLSHPDKVLLEWINAEFELFKGFEEKLYTDIYTTPFSSLDYFIKSANEILNRRKARAGKSLEHHLSSIFSANQLIFEEQAITESNKRPDFLFPNGMCYHNIAFPAQNITILGAKTTCKDRWRQVITEADRVDVKYLFTLQQGVSSNQLKEMKDSNVRLVVPQQHISSFPKEYQSELNSLRDFIHLVKEKQDRIPKHFLF